LRINSRNKFDFNVKSFFAGKHHSNVLLWQFLLLLQMRETCGGKAMGIL
jgi:hypothetical protein